MCDNALKMQEMKDHRYADQMQTVVVNLRLQLLAVSEE